MDLESSHTLTAGIPFPEGRTAEWQFTNDTKEGDSSAPTPIGTKAPGGLKSVCKANTSINRFPARAPWLGLNEPKAKSEKGSMNGGTFRERNSSLNLSMKHSYHGRRRTNAVTARMNSARLRLKIFLVRSICGTSSQ